MSYATGPFVPFPDAKGHVNDATECACRQRHDQRVGSGDELMVLPKLAVAGVMI